MMTMEFIGRFCLTSMLVTITLHFVDCNTSTNQYANTAVSTNTDTPTSSEITTGLVNINGVVTDYYQNGKPTLPSRVPVTWDYIESRMVSDDTEAFLATFKPGFQRDLIHKQLLSCPLSRLCGFELVSTMLVKIDGRPCCERCSCDFPNCLEFGTCCVDVLVQNTSIAMETMSAASPTQDWTDVRKTKCLPLHLTYNNVVDKNELDDGAFMYDSCPPGIGQMLLNNCTRKYTNELSSYEDVIPVISLLSGDLYRNIYCAYCNDVYNTDLVKANVYLTCNEQLPLSTEEEIIRTVFDGEDCDISFKFHLPYKPCTVSTAGCNITGNWINFDSNIEKSCQLYRSTILINGENYKNIFCALCNGVDVGDAECEWDGPRSITFGFSGLLKLEAITDAVLDDDRSEVCADNQLYDYVISICRDILCPPLTTLIYGQCFNVYTDVQAALYTLYLKIVPLEGTTMLEAHTFANKLLDYVTSRVPLFYTGVCGLQLMYHIAENATATNKTINIDNVPLEYYKLRIQIYLSQFHVPSELYGRYILLHKSEHRIAYFDYDEKLLKTYNVKFELVDLAPKQFDKVAELSVAFFELYDSTNDRPPLPLLLLFLAFTTPTNESGEDIPHVRTYDYLGRCGYYKLVANDVLYLNKCPKVLIEQDETVWTLTDHGAMFIKGKFNVNYSSFFEDLNGDMMICTDVYRDYMAPFMLSKKDALSPVTIVSIVSSSLSILSLLCTSIVFLIFSQLRKTLPGKTNLSLVLVLLCAQCMYLVSSMGDFDPGTWQCVMVGVMLHFFWLLSIMWMNVCTYHMFHVLTRTKLMSSTGVCRFIMYHVYAITMSVIPVVVNISVSMVTSDSYGYGVTVCYISSQDMVLYTFGIPVSIIILCNICMYLIVVYKIRRSPSVQKNVKHERNDLLIFVKLSTVTGATWIFGFIYIWTDIIVLSYLFIIFNAGQGLFILFALVLNRRVLNLFRNDVLGHSVTTTDSVYSTSKTTARNNHN